MGHDGGGLLQRLSAGFVTRSQPVRLAKLPRGRSAEVRSRFTVMQQLPDFPLQCVITGYYEDKFAYDEQLGWHFTERRMKPKLAGDLSRHLKYDLADA